jgi:hypothetical protein
MGSGTARTYRRLSEDASAAEKRLPAAGLRSMLRAMILERFLHLRGGVGNAAPPASEAPVP